MIKVLHLVSFNPYYSNRLLFQLRVNKDIVENTVLTYAKKSLIFDDNTPVHFIPDFKFPIQRTRIGRFLKDFLRNLLLIKYFLKCDKDVILHVHENNNIFGLFFWAVILNRKAVWDPHDYFHEAINKIRLFYISILERILITNKKVPVLVVSTGMHRIYQTQYPTGNFTLLRNFSSVKRSESDIKKILLSRMQENNPIRIIYFGQLKQDRLNIACLKAIAMTPNVELHLFGRFQDPSYEKLVKNLIRVDCSNIKFFGKYAADTIIDILEKYDFALFPFEINRKNINFCLPNKFFQCIEAKLPMIISNMDEMSTILNTYQIGYIFDDCNYKALRNLLSNMNTSLDDYLKLVQNIVAYANNNINYDRELKKLLEVYNNA